MSRLYLPSTPFNLLVACLHALQHPDQSTDLWLIDQKDARHERYLSLFHQWEASPFTNTEIFYAKTAMLSKLQQRNKTLRSIQQRLQKKTYSEVAVGSDRRIEFQWAMHCMDQKPLGIYLDDGLYSYLGRRSHPIKDRPNHYLKKLIYGSWWHEPTELGTSPSIQQNYLFRPQKALPWLQQKPSTLIQTDLLSDSAMRSLAALIQREFNLPKQMDRFDYLIFIPHPNNIKKIKGYKHNLYLALSELTKAKKQIAIKYHPASPSEDMLNLAKYGDILPSMLASEFLYPLLGKHCRVVGDVGTAILSCNWLRPDLSITAILDEKDPFQKAFIPLYQNMNIPVQNQMTTTL